MMDLFVFVFVVEGELLVFELNRDDALGLVIDGELLRLVVFIGCF